MRVIAGSAKGTRLAHVPSGVRPVSDRAREGLFSSLAAEVPGARVLDLFAGTGALGIEALSRGAEHAVFVERDRAGLSTIRENLDRTRLAERATVVASEVNTYLELPATPFDLVLADPPYDLAVSALERTLASLSQGWLDPSGWTVVLTRGTRGPIPVVPVDWALARRLAYGDSLVILFRP